MRLQSSSYKRIGFGITIFIAAVTALTVYAAGIKDFSLSLQANDNGCTSQTGISRNTDFLNNIFGISTSLWTTDSNGYDFDCLRINLNQSTANPIAMVTKDFRACLQFADSMSLDKNGDVKSHSQTGSVACTPWATEGGGTSNWASDSNKYDPDGGRISLETRSLPAGTETPADVRFGIQLSDKSCTQQVGTLRFTPWLSQGGGWSNWAADKSGNDPDCARITMEVVDVVAAGDPCIEQIVCSDQKILSLANNPGNPGEGTQHAVAPRLAGSAGIPNLGIFAINKDLTYETWIYKIGHNRYGGIITTGVADMRSNGWPSWYASGDGKSLTFRVGRSSDSNQCKGNCHEYNLNQEIATGKWTHLAVTVSNGATLTWYVNGSQVKQENLAGWDTSATPTLNKVYLGNEFPGAPEYSNANLDEIRVWNVARTATQIKETMNTKISAGASGLMNYWNFDNGTGTDLTGNTDTLQLISGATIKADPAINPLKLCTRDICPATPPSASPECSDQINNDADQWIDYPNDPGCDSASDNTESPNPQCSNGIDDDGDGKMDFGTASTNDIGCTSLRDNDESNAAVPTVLPRCADGIDNDNDGKIDLVDTADCLPPGAGEPIAAPVGNSCTLTATPATIALNVGSSKLEWNCTSGPVTISAVNNPAFASVPNQPATGSLNVSPNQTTTFRATSPNASDDATVTVGGTVFDETGGL